MAGKVWWLARENHPRLAGTRLSAEDPNGVRVLYRYGGCRIIRCDTIGDDNANIVPQYKELSEALPQSWTHNPESNPPGATSHGESKVDCETVWLSCSN